MYRLYGMPPTISHEGTMILMTNKIYRQASAEFGDTPPFDSGEQDDGEDVDREPDGADDEDDSGVVCD